MQLALAVFLCLGSGFALASLWIPRSTSSASALMLKVSMSTGFGLGIDSVVFVLCRLCGVENLIVVDAFVFLVSLGAALWLRAATEPAVAARSASSTVDVPRWLQPLLSCALIVAVGVSLYSTLLRVIAHPHGNGWDAFAIWNLHARFLFLGGSHWRDGFSPLIPWAHPDYPLLLPGAIAHFWTYLGHDDPRVPAIIGLVFTFSTIGILFSALSILRGQTIAMLGALSLVRTPFFIEQGASQYADVPLSFFVLATIALLSLHDDRSVYASHSSRLIAGAGFTAAMAAWTKNEGLLFLFAILAVRIVVLLSPTILGQASVSESENRAESWKTFATLVAAAAPMLFLIAWFKHFVAPPGDLFSDSSKTRPKLLDPTRYWAILQWFVKGFLRFGNWLLIPGTLALIGFYVLAGNTGSRKPVFGVRSSALALTFTLVGYFVVYLITPYDIYWHLRFSLTRLFLQLWPSAIFLLFLAVPLSQRRPEA